MSYADRVRSAPNLPAAMLALAEGIDELLATKPAQADPWGPGYDGWNAPSTDDLRAFADSAETAIKQEAFAAHRVRQNAKAIAACEAKIAEASDPEDVQALQAQLRLLKDDGASIDIQTPGGTRAHTTEEGETAVVHIPTPSPERQRIRKGWAHDVGLAAFVDHLTVDEFLDAYAVGGPTWLYAGNREAVMAMPAHYRVAMIEDLEQDSPAAAQEMARDILKDAEPHGAMGTTLAGIVGDD